MSPCVSVIVPVYGVEKYIERCAISLMEQTFSDIEFIFVNDCTKDKSIAILEAVLSKYPNRNARIVSKEQNEGLPSARKTGYEHSTGQYIMHIDSDDWVELNAVELLYNRAIESNADMVYCDWVEEYADYSAPFKQKSLNRDQYFEGILSLELYAYAWNRLCKRSLYEGVTFPVYNMLEDYVLTSQLLIRAKSVSYLDRVIVHYNKTNEGSIMSTNKVQQIMTQKVNNIYWVHTNVVPVSDNISKRCKVRQILTMGMEINRRKLYSMIDPNIVKYIRKQIRKIPVSKKWGVSYMMQVWLHIFF